jgi:hypothetical protein
MSSTATNYNYTSDRPAYSSGYFPKATTNEPPIEGKPIQQINTRSYQGSVNSGESGRFESGRGLSC